MSKHNNSNNPGCFLAAMLKKRQAKKYIKDILKKIEHFYKQLYKNPHIEVGKVIKYLEGKNGFLSLQDREKQLLSSEITEEEVLKSIVDLKNGKAPGPDGLTAKFFNIFKEELTKRLANLMNNILTSKQIQDSWQYTYITLIPKESSDLTSPRNYRPVSLFNTNYKIYAKILVERIKKVLNEHISEAQFLPGHQLKDNIWMLMNFIEYYDKKFEKEVAFVFIDVGKVFERVNWAFLIELLKKMDVGQKFTNVVEAIYTWQRASIIINDELSCYFDIERGTKQGCPLSPLLFITVLEVLLRQIQTDEEIKGAQHRGFSNKYRAYADDWLFIIENPVEYIRNLIEK